MIVLSGADLVLPDRVQPRGAVFIEGDRIVAVESRAVDAVSGADVMDVSDRIVVPGFIDVHVHGVEGRDVLDGHDAVIDVASRLPRYGVTAFCPTSVACAPDRLERMLAAIAAAPADGGSARPHATILPAHLESNFINPDYRGAQPVACLRLPRYPSGEPRGGGEAETAYGAGEILAAIAGSRPQVGIITLAPELDGGMDLVRELSAAGHIVSVGHSGATYEETVDAIAAGVSHATHLFNRMTPMSHRAPGVAGAVLASPGVRAELICDGFHVHPAVMQVALRAKGTDGILAITDGTAGSGLPVGSRARLGDQTIVITERTAELEDGTLAGSVLTMDKAFRTLVEGTGLTLVDAATVCATTPARHLGLTDRGRIGVGSRADLVLLDRNLRVRETFIAGTPWRNRNLPASV